jgi:GH24 family phage-related lysozyme (muramidase)
MALSRRAIAGLSVSAAALVGLALSEGYTDLAIVPTKGDRPTVGFGSTFRDDGTPVQMGDAITPPQALKRTLAHIQKDENGIKRCVTGALLQAEYDVLVDFTYQYGVTATCNSSMVRHINAGDYEQACQAYTKYRFSQGRDCSLPQHWGPGGCKGVWLRNLKRRDECLAAAKGD